MKRTALVLAAALLAAPLLAQEAGAAAGAAEKELPEEDGGEDAAPADGAEAPAAELPPEGGGDADGDGTGGGEQPGGQPDGDGTGGGQKFRVVDIAYTSNGGAHGSSRTRTSALRRAVSPNRTLVLESQEDLDAYCRGLAQNLENTRLFKDVVLDPSYVISAPDAEGVCNVTIAIAVTDSGHVLGLPKPSYDSNEGAELKVKLKDQNFLGTMETLNIDLNGRIGDEDEPWNVGDSLASARYILGFNFDYDFPFTVGPTKDKWTNDFSFDWTVGEGVPEYSYSTGIVIGIPLDESGMNNLNFSFTQSVIRDADYAQYGDEVYLVEEAGVSLPLTIGLVNNITPVTYTPSVTFTKNWDLDGIDPQNEDLRGPTVTVAQGIGLEQVDWHGNFRTGYSLSGTQYVTWNFKTRNIMPYVGAEAAAYKALGWFGGNRIGINADVYFYAMMNGSQSSVGPRMRGILDNQYYDAEGYDEKKALETSAAIQFSIDVPFRIITTDWGGWGRRLFGPHKEAAAKWPKALRFIPEMGHTLGKWIDFEMQFSPFLDVALLKNDVTGNLMNPKEGYYSAGMEVLVFPARWKSFVVRGSVGLDIGRILLGSKLDTSFRDTAKKSYEIFFGLGLQF